MLKEMLNADTIFSFTLFESAMKSMLEEQDYIKLYNNATEVQAALLIAICTDRLDGFFESIGCIEIDLMIYNVSHAYYEDKLDGLSINAMKKAVLDCYNFYKDSYNANNSMNLQILVQRECVSCGGTVNTFLYYDGTPESKKPHNSDCECGCTLQLSVLNVVDGNKQSFSTDLV